MAELSVCHNLINFFLMWNCDMIFYHRSLERRQGTSVRFRPRPHGRGQGTAELIQIVQYWINRRACNEGPLRVNGKKSQIKAIQLIVSLLQVRGQVYPPLAGKINWPTTASTKAVQNNLSKNGTSGRGLTGEDMKPKFRRNGQSLAHEGTVKLTLWNALQMILF